MQSSWTVIVFDNKDDLSSVIRGFACNKRYVTKYFKKHCQRHNGPEGWVKLAKVICLGHITTSNIKFDQI